MWLDKTIRWVCLCWIFVIAGCALVSDDRDFMSDQEKAQLNLQLGVRYLDMGKLETAQNKLFIAYKLDSKNAETNNALGVLYERLGQQELAERYYRDATRLAPDNPSIKNTFGRYLCDTGDYDDGIALLEQALATPLNNRTWFSYTALARCYLLQGETQRAEVLFRKALNDNEQYAPALLEMQKISYHSGNYLSARAFLERYLAVAQHTEQTLWYGVQTERALGNRSLAEEYRSLLLSLFPNSKEAEQIKSAMNR